MYKPSKIKHPSVRNTGKKKNGKPAYASSATTPAGPESSRNYTAEEPAEAKAGAPAAEDPAAPESTKGKRAHAEAPVSKPAAAESTTDEPTATAPAQEPETQNRTGEETHKPVLNEDEQKKIVNQSSSASSTNYDDSQES